MKTAKYILTAITVLAMTICAMAVTASAETAVFIPSENPPAVTDFTDTFDGSALSDKWTQHYAATTAASEIIGVADGKYTAKATNWNTYKSLKLTTGDAAWMDYAVEASLSVAAQDPRSIGVMVRASDVGAARNTYKGYYVAIDADKRSYVVDGTNSKYAELPLQIDVYGCDGSAETLLATFEVADKHFAKNTFFDLKVLVCGNAMDIYLDGSYAGRYVDESGTYKSGVVGINQYMAAFSMDSFTVRGLTDEEYAGFGIEAEPEKPDFSNPTGDANDDGKVNPRDTVYLCRYLAGWDGYDNTAVNIEGLDLDADGEITSSDAAVLMRYIAGWIGYESFPYTK